MIERNKEPLRPQKTQGGTQKSQSKSEVETVNSKTFVAFVFRLVFFVVEEVLC